MHAVRALARANQRPDARQRTKTSGCDQRSYRAAKTYARGKLALVRLIWSSSISFGSLQFVWRLASQLGSCKDQRKLQCLLAQAKFGCENGQIGPIKTRADLRFNFARVFQRTLPHKTSDLLATPKECDTGRLETGKSIINHQSDHLGLGFRTSKLVI